MTFGKSIYRDLKRLTNQVLLIWLTSQQRWCDFENYQINNYLEMLQILNLNISECELSQVFRID